MRLSRGDVPEQLISQSERLLEGWLKRVESCIRDGMVESLMCLPNHVSPRFFYSRIRPYLAGWLNNSTLPKGVVYEGVQGERRLRYSGGSAAQSSLVAALDLYLGISHAHSAARDSWAFLKRMRAYMPAPHRRFLEDLEEDLYDPETCIRSYVLRLPAAHPVRTAYDDCVYALSLFRERHIGIVKVYIVAQAEDRVDESGLEGAAGGGGQGTGGSDPISFLKPLRDQTAASLSVITPN
jgi:indoleamine 2,3-dioxygenase